MPLREGHVPIEDRALLFSDAIYEVIAAYDGVPVLLEEHLDRWERSAAGLRIKQANRRETRYEVISELIRRFGNTPASIYGQMSRGVARRAHLFPTNPQPLEFWFIRDLPAYPPAFYTEGAAVVTHPDERWGRCWIKSTCLLANCLAKQFAADHGAFEAVLHGEDETVREGAATNVYTIRDGAIHTHPADGRILAGCTRALLIDLARAQGIDVHEEKYDLEFLRNADEVFITSTTVGVLPVTRCDGQKIGPGLIGPVTRQLMDLFAREIGRVRETALHAP